MPDTARRLRAVLATALSIPTLIAATAAANSVTVKVHDPAALSAEKNLSVEQRFDYGSFQWLQVDAETAERLTEAGAADIQDMRLTLGGVTFDPVTATASAFLPDAWRGLDGDRDDLRYVQMQAPVRQDWLDTLKARGLEPVQYIHPQTYIVWGSGQALESLTQGEQRASFVRATGDFEPAFRVQPSWRSLSADAVDVKVYFYAGADVDQAVAKIEGLGGQLTSRAALDRTLHSAAFSLAGDRFADVARIPGVYSIQPVPTDGGLRGEMSNQINVGNYDATNLAFPGYMTWIGDTGYDGTGIIMANVDGGIFDTHPDLINRMLPCTGQTCGGNQTDTHGTHTAGIMAGDGSSGVTDGDGFLRGLGVAPNANLVEQVYSPFFTQAGGMLLLMADSVRNNAVLSGNSWGPAGSPRGYDGDTRQVDVGVRDTDDTTAGDQGLLYVLSFMNGGGGTSTQGTPDEAKNLFNIGSTKMQNSGGQILAIDDLSANSAHGPALDGRTIPHMVAPGCSVDSTLTSTGYGLNCGTSMASPHVSGAAGLFHQKYRDQNSGADPSPALVKAAFIAVARDLEGFDDADGNTLGHAFDSKQGWGRMDLEAVMNPPTDVVFVDQTHTFDNTGEQWIETFSVDDPSQPVRLMLTWTDAPGHGTGGSTPAWNNDLDLIVRVNGQTYRGNVFANGVSTTGGAADAINNTEGVFFAPFGAATSIEIEVLATDVNSDALPHAGDATDQDFALVCYNCSAALNPVIFSNGFEDGTTNAWDIVAGETGP
ncbi:MAG: S8 family serine peptidase [Acidobacteriota bacterium]